MSPEAEYALAGLIFAAAVLYSAVGHAGASGYLAAMALFSVSPEAMRPAALVLNILVASVAAVRFARAGYFRWSSFWPYALASVPLAYLGGGISISSSLYKILIGSVLIWSAVLLFSRSRAEQALPMRAPAIPLRLACGGAIGLLAGLTGVGGGIFLSPLLILRRWEETRITSGVTAAFILVNSVAGLAGQVSALSALPAGLPYWAAAAVLGGWLGSSLGSRRFNRFIIQRLLALVLVIAGAKLLLT